MLKQEINEKSINDKNIESRILKPVTRAKPLKKKAPPIELDPGNRPKNDQYVIYLISAPKSIIFWEIK